ncbi:MAG: branched-chain amino acid ABC transporter permease [Gammaproteobacteria bacterium]
MTLAVGARGVFVLAVALAAGLPSVLGAYQLNVAVTLLMWIALAQSWTILSGLAGYVSLGHVVFYGLGAYTTVVTWKLLPLVIAVPLAGLVAALFALAVGAPVLRVRGPYFAILTFGLAELVKFSVINLEAALGKSSRLLFGAPSTTVMFYALLGLAAAATALTHGVRHGRLGRALIAIREDETTAETIGIAVARYKIIAFALSALIPGMVGALMVLRSSYFEAMQVFSPTISFTIVTMAIIGGADDARGPIVGAVFLTLLAEVLWARAPQLYMILLGLLLVGFVLFAPRGIVGTLAARPGPAA